MVEWPKPGRKGRKAGRGRRIFRPATSPNYFSVFVFHFTHAPHAEVLTDRSRAQTEIHSTQDMPDLNGFRGRLNCSILAALN